MNAQLQLRKPSNWQDFELLCKKLWGEIWKCEDTIQRNGWLGQKQNGVDVYGIPLGVSQYYGVQCKRKDEYTHAQLTKTEIDSEINKARNFSPTLKRFIFASTSNKDTEIENTSVATIPVCIIIGRYKDTTIFAIAKYSSTYIPSNSR